MGCDIHMRIEQYKNDKWVYYPYQDKKGNWEIDISRDYALFAILAGVREEHASINLISSPRGWPDNVDPLTRSHELYEGTNVFFENFCEHSHSWLTLYEILDFFNISNVKWKNKTKIQKERAELIEDVSIDWLYTILRENIQPDLRNIRIIFGFDS